MAELTRKQLDEVVARVTEEVANEVRTYEREMFRVGDLRSYLTELVDAGGGSAWKITYDTSSGVIQGLSQVARLGGDPAWKITYDTSSGRFAPGLETEQ